MISTSRPAPSEKLKAKSGDLPLLVVHVYRSTFDGEEEIIRIISARKASERESRRYFGQAVE